MVNIGLIMQREGSITRFKAAYRGAVVLGVSALLLILGTPVARGGVADLFLYGNFGQGTPAIEGSMVSDLVNHENFPDTPGITSESGIVSPIEGSLQYPQPFEQSDNLGDDYGSMTRGYLEVPETGDYRFFLSSDDGSRLELSTDHTASNREQIAEVPGNECCQPFVNDGIRSSDPIRLEKGSQYYFRVLHKEGSGGDWVRVGWTGPTFEEPTVIPMRFVQRFIETDGPPVITKQPESKEVMEQNPVVFSVHVDAKAPVTYQWIKSGQPIPDGVNSSIELTPGTTDDGVSLKVRVSNPFGETESEEVTLTVQPDMTAPTVESAQTFGNPNGLTVEFSEPIEEASGTDPANYSINNGVEVNDATLAEDPGVVRLSTSEIPEGQPYTLTVDNVRDRAEDPNPITSDSEVDFVQSHGVITRKVFTGIPGNLVVDLTGAEQFPENPDLVTYPDALDGPQDFGSNYGTQFQGYVVPPETGEYTFYISSWGFSKLFLSTGPDPENKRVIAEEPNATGLTDNPPRNWTGEVRRPVVDPETGRRANVSEPISLEAGKKYYIEVLHKQGSGSDNVGVAWQRPDESEPQEGNPPIQGKFLSAFASLGPVTLTKTPQSQTVRELDSVTFQAGIDGSPPYSLQWLRNGEPIEGETGRTLTFPEVGLDDNEATFSLHAENRFSETTSPPVTLTVTPDNSAPELVEAEGNADWVQLRFSEPVSEATATVAGNYSIDQGIEVTEARLLEGGTQVRLTTSAKENETTYTVTVDGVADRAAASNTITDQSIAFTTFSLLLDDRFEEGEIDSNNWGVDERPFEDGAVEGYEIAQEDGQARFSMTATGQYWGGVALQTARDFVATPENPLIFEIDRVMHEGSGTAQRTGVWITHSDREDYVLFAENVGEGGWQYNRQIGQSGDNPTGVGTVIEQFASEEFTDQGDHRIKLEANGETVKLYLDGVLGAEVAFPFQEDIRFAFGGYVRANEDSLTAAFDNAELSFRAPEGETGLQIVEGPSDRTVIEGRSATFSVDITSPLPGAEYQWQRNQSDIPDATSSSYTTPALSLDDDGALYRVVVSPPLADLGAPVTSGEARLTVQEDRVPPAVVSSRQRFGGGEVLVTFDEAVNPESATNPEHYSISGGVTVDNVSMGEESGTVVLETSGIAPDGSFELSVQGVTDDFGNAIAEAVTAKILLPEVVMSEDFESGTIDEERWHIDDRAFETGDADITASVEEGRLVLQGAGTEQWWGGSALAADQTFTATPRKPLIIEVARVSHEGSGTAHRSSVWITHANRQHYINFSENVGEGGWHYNRRIGASGDNGTGSGANIAAFDGESFDDQGNHGIRLVADGQTVELYLDGTFGTSVAFPFSEVGLQLGAYARDIDDTVMTSFDNVLVGHPAPEPATVAPPRLDWEIDRQAREIHLIWPDSADAYTLQVAEALRGATWEDVDTSAEVSDGERRVTLEIEGDRRFFRLRRE